MVGVWYSIYSKDHIDRLTPLCGRTFCYLLYWWDVWPFDHLHHRHSTRPCFKMKISKIMSILVQLKLVARLRNLCVFKFINLSFGCPFINDVHLSLVTDLRFIYEFGTLTVLLLTIANSKADSLMFWGVST